MKEFLMESRLLQIYWIVRPSENIILLMISRKCNYEFSVVHMTRIRDVRGIWNSVDGYRRLPSANFQIAFLNVSA